MFHLIIFQGLYTTLLVPFSRLTRKAEKCANRLCIRKKRIGQMAPCVTYYLLMIGDDFMEGARHTCHGFVDFRLVNNKRRIKVEHIA